MLKDKSIIPGKSAAGVAIGSTKDQVKEVLGIPKGEQDMTSGVELLEYPSVKVWIGKNGGVTQIGLFDGYTGQTKEGVRLGMSKEDLKKIWGYDLAYHEDDNYWSFISRENILFDFEDDKISTIYICKEL